MIMMMMIMMMKMSESFKNYSTWRRQNQFWQRQDHCGAAPAQRRAISSCVKSMPAPTQTRATINILYFLALSKAQTCFV